MCAAAVCAAEQGAAAVAQQLESKWFDREHNEQINAVFVCSLLFKRTVSG
jgi:hypothetical protein